MAISLAACSGTPTFVGNDTKAAGKSKLKTEIGDAAVLDRSDLSTPTTPSTAPLGTDARYPAGVSFREVNGIELYLDATATRSWHRGEAVEFALSVRNRTNRAIGYLTDKESHFSIVDPTGAALWTDDTCRAGPHGQLPTGFLELKPGEAVTIADYYPVRPGKPADGCEARRGAATLHGWLTVCRDLQDNWMCPAGAAERVDAKPIAINVP